MIIEKKWAGNGVFNMEQMETDRDGALPTPSVPYAASALRKNRSKRADLAQTSSILIKRFRFVRGRP